MESAHINTYIISKVTKFQIEKYLLLKNFHRVPKKMKVFYQEFSHVKISNSEFS